MKVVLISSTKLRSTQLERSRYLSARPVYSERVNLRLAIRVLDLILQNIELLPI